MAAPPPIAFVTVVAAATIFCRGCHNHDIKGLWGGRAGRVGDVNVIDVVQARGRR